MQSILEQIKNPNDIKNLNIQELNFLAQELRTFLIESISKTGGHLASNLGLVEVMLSLFKNFDFEEDKIIFDVGHQSYVYKILTGRKENFHTLRKFHGISGFPKRSESKYDFFDTGHSSNSISAALGMARARDLKMSKSHIISLIGDGALTGGMAFEALNDLGFHKTKMIVILNDNGMSISSNVGGVSAYLNHIRITPSYNSLKKKVHHRLDPILSNRFTNSIRKIKNSMKRFFLPSMFFEDLGLRYIGPIDGHDIIELNRVFRQVKEMDSPVVIHIITKKGLGYTPAMNHPENYHAVSPYDIETGKSLKISEPDYSKVFETELVSLASKDDSIVAVTAAMANGTGLSKFASQFPNRFFDVGIAEAHAVTFAAGLALEGLKPIFAVYSTFLGRGFDQLLIDIGMQNIPVIFAVDRAGLVGNDGETHQGVFDLSYASMIPNFVIIAPKTKEEIGPLLRFAKDLDHPVLIRYPRGNDKYVLKAKKQFQLGVWETIKKGNDLCIIATGRMVSYAFEVTKLLKEKGIEATLINATFIKPLDENLLKKIGHKKIPIVTIEDNALIGGLGMQITQKFSSFGFHNQIYNIAIPDHFIEHGSVDELFNSLEMDVPGLLKNILNFIKKCK